MSAINRGVALLLIDVINHFEFPDGKSDPSPGAADRTPRSPGSKRGPGKPAFPRSMSMTISASGGPNVKKLLQYCLRPEAAGPPLRRTAPAR